MTDHEMYGSFLKAKFIIKIYCHQIEFNVYQITKYGHQICPMDENNFQKNKIMVKNNKMFHQNNILFHWARLMNMI